MEQLTLDSIVENQGPLLTELCRRQGVVRDYVRGVAHHDATGLYLYGAPGTAKTYTVRELLERELREAYVYQRGHLTPMGLFELLQAHADAVIVLDDVSSIFKSDVALQLLLAALEHPRRRDRSRPVTYKRQGEDVSVSFRGGIICISNKVLHDEELLGAFKSRVYTFNYDPSNAQLGALMLDIAGRGWPVGRPAVSPRECGDVARFVIDELLRLNCRFDLRVLVDKALPLYLQAKEGRAESDWRDLVTASLEEHLIELRHTPETPRRRAERVAREREVAVQVAREHAGRGERVAAWVRRTGRSERAFYRRLSESDGG